MRYLVTAEFSKWLTVSKPNVTRVAIVGGTSLDPEVKALENYYPEVQINYFGIENSQNDSGFNFLDLNTGRVNGDASYDLVVSSQVLEHVWNIENTFNCLADLTKPGSFIWVNCPASNMAHGSPSYYSAGYTDGFISKHLEVRNFEVFISKTFGSKRNYFMTHILRYWPTPQELSHPVTSYQFQPGSILGIIRKFLRELPGRFLSLAFPNQVTDTIEFATESVVLAQLKGSSRL